MFACVNTTGSILSKTLQTPVGRSVSSIWTVYWVGKLGVSSVISWMVHKLFVFKYFFSVSDPQLFYWVKVLNWKGWGKNIMFPNISGNTVYAVFGRLWTNLIKSFSSCDILYKDTADALLDVTNFDKFYQICITGLCILIAFHEWSLFLSRKMAYFGTSLVVQRLDSVLPM